MTRLALPALVAVLAALVTAAPVAASPAVQVGPASQGVPVLQADQRVYDVTGDSLTRGESEDLERGLEILQQRTGADAVAVVRDLDATPEETLGQVEKLQQEWVARTGAAEDTAVAFLVNRDADDDTDARAGIYVGRTYEDGNVPRGEQEDIVAEALIPPLRDGDVHASLAAGIERLSGSIRDGPPRSALQEWSDGGGGGWVPWTGLGLAIAGVVVALLLHRRRETAGTPAEAPTTTRPGDLHPAVAGALVAGAPQASAVPAVERVVWEGLSERARDGLVPASGLQKVAQDSRDVREVVRARLEREGWWDLGNRGSRVGLVVVGVLALLLAAGSFVVLVAGGGLVVLVATVPLVMLALGSVVMLATFSRLSAAGQRAAVPWTAYRDGLEEAGKDEDRSLDLDAVLPDVVAMDLGRALKKRLEQATEAGALSALGPSGASAGQTVVVPWGAFAGVFASSSGAGGASGAGAGGGGGAAGST